MSCPLHLPFPDRVRVFVLFSSNSKVTLFAVQLFSREARDMERHFLVIGSISALVAVGLGAFGAHGLEGRIEPSDLDTFEVAVRYQMYHALALLFLGLVLERWPGSLGIWAGWAFVAGTLVFSGSLYALVLTGVRGLGAVTPIGGLALLVGWVLSALHLVRSR